MKNTSLYANMAAMALTRRLLYIRGARNFHRNAEKSKYAGKPDVKGL